MAQKKSNFFNNYFISNIEYIQFLWVNCQKSIQINKNIFSLRKKWYLVWTIFNIISLPILSAIRVYPYTTDKVNLSIES